MTSFSPQELERLRSYFRDEASAAFERMVSVVGQLSNKVTRELRDELLRDAHTLKGSAGTVELPGLVDVIHALEEQFTELPVGDRALTNEQIASLIHAIDEIRTFVDDASPTKSGDNTAAARALTDASYSLRHPTAPGAPELSEHAPHANTAPVLRVTQDRIDGLLHHTSELLVDRTRLQRRTQQVRHLVSDLQAQQQQTLLAKATQEVTTVNDFKLGEQITLLARVVEDLLRDTEHLRQTEANLQQAAINLRMVNAETLFQRLGPLIRDIARAEGKQVELCLSGGDTLFDAFVAQRLFDALVQLIRNAIVHGIELPVERVAAGKPSAGTIDVHAQTRGDRVVFELADDGRGIDSVAIKHQLVTSGLMTKTATDRLTDQELVTKIFEPGLSTRTQLDENAGRGVGLDAVKQSLTKLGGHITASSTPASGTRFTLTLPIHTAVCQARLYKLGDDIYAIPRSAIFRGPQSDAMNGSHATIVDIENQHDLPFVDLHTELRNEPPVGRRDGVILEYAGTRFVVSFDRDIGPARLVVKPVGPLLEPIALFAGATISASGKVQFILDPAALARLAGVDEDLISAADQSDKLARNTHIAGHALVVDDSHAIREALRRILQRLEYVVDTASDGAAAWKLAQLHAYDVIFTDIEMPTMTGFELLKRLNDSNHPASDRTIMISSRDDKSTAAKARALGAQALLPKPLNRDAIQAELARLPARPTE